ncbi:16S rRNA processing protein RimM [Legionella quinlivanii]|uniref:Ribosome maturation factor RimM n=1 Tax=Legionella quinlivanii TaxID=45073 RepID=A0A0W0XZ48_9GAMM|nr:ribosome maturation factor RimM [Legionella quinlivanii]KTD49682.1 16S rRNA processing protein RimM [Legionella quinlivanii]MCW8451951.1 ribosome maturation factor RimM [Legionella quinlivanii]SEG30316.1 16S rRNA processing protein RimM [Legionella quinlivanii DSM 21216]STY09852.1 16S rRNA processing protein RimM [Legionella quinlivanii]
MSDLTDWIIVGRFGRVHGIKGLITVHSFTEPRNNILDYADWHISIAKQWQPVELSQVELSDKHILVRVKGYNEREEAAKLTNVEIAISSKQLPVLEPDEFYWHQLVGLKVINQSNELLGTVSEVIATGSNDVLIVNGERRHLIPYLPGHYVIKVDLSQQQILVDWDADF